jgi:hypothetical protein
MIRDWKRSARGDLVKLKRVGNALHAGVEFPADLQGEFVWKTKQCPLRESKKDF